MRVGICVEVAEPGEVDAGRRRAVEADRPAGRADARRRVDHRDGVARSVGVTLRRSADGLAMLEAAGRAAGEEEYDEPHRPILTEAAPAHVAFAYVRGVTVPTIDQLRKIAVIGAGTMGHGIAQVGAMMGVEVRLYDALTGVARSGSIVGTVT